MLRPRTLIHFEGGVLSPPNHSRKLLSCHCGMPWPRFGVSPPGTPHCSSTPHLSKPAPYPNLQHS
eukprot:12618348-Prorocentrum_lima.AAC.1